MIELKQLEKVYRTDEIETSALRELNLQIAEGEFVSIMGESGCGKSTLLNIIGLLDRPTKGSYKFKGQELGKLSEKERTSIRKQHIGFVFQSFNLIDELRVEENIALPLVYLRKSKKERKQRVDSLMEQMGIAHRARHYPQQLSGGQQQRVALCRAVVAQPTLILADEPTGNLDSRRGAEVMELLTRMNEEGTTIVMVTHSRHDANYSSRIVHLADGQLVNEEFNRVEAI